MRDLVLAFTCAAFLAATTVAPAVADQNDPRLDALFDALASAPGQDAAEPIESRIWSIWLTAEDEKVNELMQSGIGLLNTGDMDGALSAFTQIVSEAPDFAEGWNKRATTLYLMGRFAESKADIARVLKLEPRHFGALSGLGLCNQELGLIRESINAFRRALAVDPNLPGARQDIEELTARLKRNSL